MDTFDTGWGDEYTAMEVEFVVPGRRPLWISLGMKTGLKSSIAFIRIGNGDQWQTRLQKILVRVFYQNIDRK